MARAMVMLVALLTVAFANSAHAATLHTQACPKGGVRVSVGDTLWAYDGPRWIALKSDNPWFTTDGRIQVRSKDDIRVTIYEGEFICGATAQDIKSASGTPATATAAGTAIPVPTQRTWAEMLFWPLVVLAVIGFLLALVQLYRLRRHAIAAAQRGDDPLRHGEPYVDPARPRTPELVTTVLEQYARSLAAANDPTGLQYGGRQPVRIGAIESGRLTRRAAVRFLQQRPKTLNLVNVQMFRGMFRMPDGVEEMLWSTSSCMNPATLFTVDGDHNVGWEPDAQPIFVPAPVSAEAAPADAGAVPAPAEVAAPSPAHAAAPDPSATVMLPIAMRVRIEVRDGQIVVVPSGFSELAPVNGQPSRRATRRNKERSAPGA